MNVRRRVGLEQEFFLVDEAGVLSNQADAFLVRCKELARRAGRVCEAFAPECAACMVEINTPPVYSLSELSREYRAAIELALEAGRDLGLRLYPLATYPLEARPSLRHELRYELQARTVGRERFQNAGRCAGVHLHLEAAAGTVDRRVGVSYGASKAAREELLNLYNLATALDAALVALSRSCPFYAGEYTGLATRTTRYRGDAELFPNGLYAELHPVGGLRPYAGTIEELVELQFARYHAWLEAMDRAGVERQLFFETGDGLLEASWNPVRLNPAGTIELRAIDSNYPKPVLAIGALVKSAADRVRREHLSVLPQKGLRVFEFSKDKLYVPDFEYLSAELFREAVFEGIESSRISAYLDSIFEFSRSGEESSVIEELKTGDSYRSTEAEILLRFPAASALTEEIGLRLVREACSEMEEQVATLEGWDTTEMTQAGANGN